MDDCDGWSECEDTIKVPLPGGGSLVAQPIDTISNRIVFEDGPSGQDESYMPISPLHDLHLDSLTSKAKDPNQARKRRSIHNHSLSLSEIQELRDIAMPHYALSIRNATRTKEVDDGYSPKQETEVPNKKRKSSTASEGAETINLSESRKRGHNAIEKRYRSNLNNKITALRQRVPSLRVIPEGEFADTVAGEADGSSSDAVHSSGKAEILTKAAEYISHLEGTVERLDNELVVLSSRVLAFEKLAMSGSIVMGSGPSLRDALQTVQAGKLG
jgi:hypothetical protein